MMSYFLEGGGEGVLTPHPTLTNFVPFQFMHLFYDLPPLSYYVLFWLTPPYPKIGHHLWTCSEKATVDLTVTTQDKSKVEISQNFVTFSEYMNFTKISFDTLADFYFRRLSIFLQRLEGTIITVNSLCILILHICCESCFFYDMVVLIC